MDFECRVQLAKGRLSPVESVIKSCKRTEWLRENAEKITEKFALFCAFGCGNFEYIFVADMEDRGGKALVEKRSGEIIFCGLSKKGRERLGGLFEKMRLSEVF